jgi:hypothetical protein
MAEEVLDVPDFDFSSEMEAVKGGLPMPAEGWRNWKYRN